MGDVGDTFKAFKEQGKSRRHFNMKRGPEILREHGISFTSHNDGAHLIVITDDYTVDFWPSTGKWIFRKLNKSGRGVLKLVEMLGVKKRAYIVYKNNELVGIMLSDRGAAEELGDHIVEADLL